MITIQDAYSLGTRLMRILPTNQFLKYHGLGPHGLTMQEGSPKVTLRTYSTWNEDYVPDMREGYVVGSLLNDYRKIKDNPLLYTAPLRKETDITWGLFDARNGALLFSASSEAEVMVLALEDLYPEKVK